MTAQILSLLAASGALALAGCTSVRPWADFATQCLFENDVPGTYAFDAGMAVPVVTPVEDGTQDGAAILNACIQAKAAEPTSAPPPPVTTVASAPVVRKPAMSEPRVRREVEIRSPRPLICPPGAPVLYGGTQYCLRH